MIKHDCIHCCHLMHEIFDDYKYIQIATDIDIKRIQQIPWRMPPEHASLKLRSGFTAIAVLSKSYLKGDSDEEK
jgi:hypothetical protein